MAALMAAADTAAAPPPPPPAAEPTEKVSPASSDMAPPATAADTATPPPPVAAPPAAAAVTAAPPPPPPATDPAVHVAAPTVAADTAARPAPPPPAPEFAAKVSHVLPPFPHQPDAPAPKKRKLGEAGFHTSPYYKIRATVADLRLRFIQVHEATDFRKSDAAREILREIRIVMELSKKLRLDLSPTSEPVKASEKPLAGAVKDGPTEPTPSGERNQVPPTGQTAIPPSNANDGVPATQA